MQRNALSLGWLVVLGMAGWLAPAGWGGKACAMDSPGAGPAGVPMSESQPREKLVVPKLSVKNIKVDELLKLVRGMVEGKANIVFAAPKGVEVPTVQSLEATNLALDQFFVLLEHMVPGIRISFLPADPVPAYFVGYDKPDPAEGGTIVRLISLSHAIETQAQRIVKPVATEAPPEPPKDLRTKALNDVLKLIDAATAFAAVGHEGAAPVIQVHQETEVLMVRGTPEQVRLVEQAISSVAPPAEESTSGGGGGGGTLYGGGNPGPFGQ
jgi:hypothetical protein